MVMPRPLRRNRTYFGFGFDVLFGAGFGFGVPPVCFFSGFFFFFFFFFLPLSIPNA